MNNISYTITELNNDISNNDSNNDISNNDISNYNISNIDNDSSYDIDIYVYNTYNVKQLSLILQYYDITKGRMCKDEIIQTILLFERDYHNLNIVNKRKYLWSIATQLKNDDFFSKYIVFDIK